MVVKETNKQALLTRCLLSFRNGRATSEDVCSGEDVGERIGCLRRPGPRRTKASERKGEGHEGASDNYDPRGGIFVPAVRFM